MCIWKGNDIRKKIPIKKLKRLLGHRDTVIGIPDSFALNELLIIQNIFSSQNQTAREQDEHYSSPDEQATAIFDLLVQAAGINDEVTITNTTADDGSVSETVTVILEDRSPSSVEEMSVKTSAMAEVVGNSGTVSETVTFIMENVVDDSASETVSAVRDGHGPDEEEDAHLTPSAMPALHTDTQVLPYNSSQITTKLKTFFPNMVYGNIMVASPFCNALCRIN